METSEAREQLAAERARLEGLRDQFEAECLTTESEAEDLEALTTISRHLADVRSETFDGERDFSIVEQVEAELAECEHALRRLDDRTYGLCEACGNAIDGMRLEAKPQARLCRDDQETAEREAHGHSPPV